MSDLIIRLRRGFGGIVPPVNDEAANEIEELRKMNAELLLLVTVYHKHIPWARAEAAIAKAEKLK